MFGFQDKKRCVTQEDLDMIRIKADDMDSTNDRLFLMEKLHKHIQSIESELEKYRDKELGATEAKKRDELLRLREDAQDIRQKILAYKIKPQRFGLFIKYPKDYEG